MFGFFKSLFTKHGIIQEQKDPMKKFLIVGLGNIGDEYAETRHNIGFKVLDEVAQANDFTFETAKLGDIGSYKIKGRTIICLKPSTYMNRSGKALKYWMDKENIPQSNVLVITDDINLPFGTIRIKTKGSNGGHNGLKDIELFLQTILYNRYRFGVGADFGKGRQVEYVLGQWDDEEKALLPERLKKSTEIINSFVLSGIARTMNQYNNT
jgi:PTH1 family peptidyl-tRNA hydrolase